MKKKIEKEETHKRKYKYNNKYKNQEKYKIDNLQSREK